MSLKHRGFQAEADVYQSLQQYVDEGRVAGIVNLVVRNGEVIHYEATGNRGADNPRQCRWMTCFVFDDQAHHSGRAMQLYEQGKFQLTDPVTKFVPELKDLNILDASGEFVPVGREMTMHQLLMHTTGMSYGFAATDAVDRGMQWLTCGLLKTLMICPRTGQAAAQVSSWIAGTIPWRSISQARKSSACRVSPLTSTSKSIFSRLWV